MISNKADDRVFSYYSEKSLLMSVCPCCALFIPLAVYDIYMFCFKTGVFNWSLYQFMHVHKAELFT